MCSRKPLSAISTREISQLIKTIADEGHSRSALALRSALVDVYKEAMADGLVKENPAALTRSPRVAVKRERLTLDPLLQILDAAKTLDPWVGNSIRLALLTGQRREDEI